MGAVCSYVGMLIGGIPVLLATLRQGTRQQRLNAHLADYADALDPQEFHDAIRIRHI